MKTISKKLMLSMFLIISIISITWLAVAANAVTLGVANSFAILAGSTVTNTGTTIIDGDLGLSPGTAATGFPPGVINNGIQHLNDAVAVQAQSDLVVAYNNAAGQSCDHYLTGQDLGGMVLTPGVYCFNSSAQLTGALTLDGQNNSNPIFIFQIGSTLTTASNSSIVLINSAQACNIFWQVGSSATLGTDTLFKGNILALTSITLNTRAGVDGRVLARNGAITLDTNIVNKAICAIPATLHVIKTVINTGGGTAVPSDFNIHVKNASNVDVASSPALGVGTPGTSYSLSPGTYTVSEDIDSHYTRTFAGWCDLNGSLTLAAGR